MHALLAAWWLQLVMASAIGLAAGQNPAPIPPPASASSSKNTDSRPPGRSNSFDDVVDHAILQEHRLLGIIRNFKPVVETYLQNMKPDRELGAVPKDDQYFLSRLDLSSEAPVDYSFLEQQGWAHRLKKKIPTPSQTFLPLGFAQAIFPDRSHFDRENYTFEFVRWEVLGEVRCVVMDVTPRQTSGSSGFFGRMWVEDQDFNIVRFMGTYTSKSRSKYSFHFDSWRLNVMPRLWLPAFVYTEESDPNESSSRGIRFKAQTRLWGYDLQHAGDHKEYTKPLTDRPLSVGANRAEPSQDLSPALSEPRAQYYSAEENVVERLQVAGLMAPAGEVDQILQIVVNNLLITNELDTIGVRCRVLLTAPLESFVVGRTIVISRGLLDVLPDEGALAAVLAHELAHVVLRHSVGSEYASTSRLLFPDLKTFQELSFRFSEDQEAAADSKGLELLSKSPYKDKLANAGLFLQALKTRAPQLPSLIRPHLSTGFASNGLVRMTNLINSTPQLEMSRTDQIAALPLGSRIKIDPWSDRIELTKTKPVRPLFAGEKIPFEVTAVYPYLKRLSSQEKVGVSK